MAQASEPRPSAAKRRSPCGENLSSRLGPFGPGFLRTVDENSRRYFRVVSARWRRRSVESFRTMAARTSRLGRMSSVHTPATTRSARRRLGDRRRERLRISSCCLTSTDSATRARAPPAPRVGRRSPRGGEAGRPGRAWPILTSWRHPRNAKEIGIRHAHGSIGVIRTLFGQGGLR